MDYVSMSLCFPSLRGVPKIQDLQGCQDQKNGQVDLDDHVHVLLSKDPCSEADDYEEQGWDKHSQQVADNRSSKGDFNNYGFCFMAKSFTHKNPVQRILAERNVRVVLQTSWNKVTTR